MKKLRASSHNAGWDVRKGDLVDVNFYSLPGGPVRSRGVVVDGVLPEQQILFPTISVYIFKTAAIATIFPNNLVEIISRAA